MPIPFDIRSIGEPTIATAAATATPSARRGEQLRNTAITRTASANCSVKLIRTPGSPSADVTVVTTTDNPSATALS
ncbi:MAG: hypothetical protein M3186_08625 [Actinomycetota bacterium]|nr:hypothetical protein [Actinomycetota bacterium]